MTGDDRQVFTIHHVLSHFIEAATSTNGVPDWNELERALINREDAMVEVLHLAAMQFGLFPQIVAEVLAEVGMGTPKTPEERAMIRRQFTDLMTAIQRAQSGEGPMPTP